MTDPIPALDALWALSPPQQPAYADRGEADRVVAQLRRLPPLVFAGECDDLRAGLAQAAAGRAFVLQGGDCAETFDTVTAASIQRRLRVLLSMSVVLTYAAEVPVVKIGRMAGQYAKPRSKEVEVRGSVGLPAYRGDAVNGFEFDAAARRHDPDRLLRAYYASAATLNLVRAFVKGGFADLSAMHSWNADFVREAHVAERYERLTGEIGRALSFMRTIGVDGGEAFRTVDFWASHEALLIDYEHALTRIDSRTGRPYNVGGHLLWIGERTRQVHGAQAELLRRLRNPLGVKVGPDADLADVVALLERLDPDREPGRITLITRLGANRIRQQLPGLVEAVEATGRKVVWVCDPMHGNTFEAATGYKTRSFADVTAELDGFFDVHQDLGTWPGGVHFELTGDDVTECVGGAVDVSEADLANRYETVCDPRLNRQQSLELAFRVADRLGTLDHPGRGHLVLPVEL
ncbi:MAG: 3-deoxy-7-phosphoheptulonate synthase class II [Propionibacteriaceae bacterium]|jgi:3-deoxy-7-phosphoheptulonate synthase|nr:3-deoxy-7-phosphoheptulonate synthase class II [Propionibacteriaceae bacterium]